MASRRRATDSRAMRASPSRSRWASRRSSASTSSRNAATMGLDPARSPHDKCAPHGCVEFERRSRPFQRDRFIEIRFQKVQNGPCAGHRVTPVSEGSRSIRHARARTRIQRSLAAALRSRCSNVHSRLAPLIRSHRAGGRSSRREAEARERAHSARTVAEDQLGVKPSADAAKRVRTSRETAPRTRRRTAVHPGRPRRRPAWR